MILIKGWFDTIKKMILSLIFIFTIISSISGCIQQNETNGNNNDKILYVGTADSYYRTIQGAIDAAKNGTTIIIQNGSYNELITINKSIDLRGEDKNTTVLQYNPGSEITQIPIITINADNCSIENLYITVGKSLVLAQGISIHSHNNTIKNNMIIGAANGIELFAFSSSNRILHNVIGYNLIGISSTGSTHNIISNNTIFSNSQYDVYLSTGSDNNTVSFNVMNNSHIAVKIYGSVSNKIYKNCINNNVMGVYCCCGGKMNYFYNNGLVNNSDANAKDNQLNIWYNNQTGTGNYWDDYNGSDMNLDGIGDTAYVINYPENTDLYPLMSPPLDVPCIK